MAGFCVWTKQCHSKFIFAPGGTKVSFNRDLSGGVMVAQGPLDAFVMVRIHAGQPVLLRRNEVAVFTDTDLAQNSQVLNSPELRGRERPSGSESASIRGQIKAFKSKTRHLIA